MIKSFTPLKVALFFTFILLLHSATMGQTASKVQLSSDVYIEKLDDGVWRHVAYKDLPGAGPFPSNGLIIQLGPRVLLVDTAWNDEQTKLILDWIEKELKPRTLLAFFTHYHEDRMGGIGELHKRKVTTTSSKLTAKLAQEHGLQSPQKSYAINFTIEGESRKVGVFYPGPGHTQDNMVVWIPDKKILFGGCLVKSARAEDLGNTKDADMAQWPKSIEKLQQRYGQARIVVPGHGDPSGTEALKHTLELLKAAPGK